MSTARDMSNHRSPRFAPDRRILTVGEVASRLEHRLYSAGTTHQAMHEGCALAVGHGLSSVIVFPRFVATVAAHLAQASVGVVTLPGWRSAGVVEPLPAPALLAEAESLVAQGATDLGMVANADRLSREGGRQLAHDVSALVGAMQARNVRVRVILDTDGLSSQATAAACELIGGTGAWLVQGGSWRGARTGLSRIQLMRAALPDGVRLKWTFPVRSLDSMMICIAEGVDLFNGDPQSLLKDAAGRISAGPLAVPVKGVDY